MKSKATESAVTGIDLLIEIMRSARDPDNGCPWDIAQTFASIAPYTIEEAYEVVDAIEREDMVWSREELGDLLLQVVFHARMAELAGDFGFNEIAAGISEKMIRRHPHVFGGAKIRSADAQTEAWETQKLQNGPQKEPLVVSARWMEWLRGSLPCSVPTNCSKGPPELVSTGRILLVPSINLEKNSVN